MRFLMFVAFAIELSGCAARPKAKGWLVTGRECMESVELGDDTECRRKDESERLYCTGLVLNVKKGCEKRDLKEKKK